jgi:hypothetical protein
VPEVIRTIGRRRLEDFALDEGRWQAYVGRFFTAPGAGVAARVLQDLERRVAARRNGGAP